MKEFLHLAGIRSWTASLLPALVGTTLPFWLGPAGFSFRWPGAIEFLLATVLFHAGFSFLQAWFERRFTTSWPASRLLTCAAICILTSYLLGYHINSNLRLNTSVYEGIFIVFGLSALFVGVLYVVPPLNFSRRVGGEIVISYSLGLLPVLGAYIVQVGDLTRTVYLASLPVVVATGLWVWIDRIARKTIDEKMGRETLIILLGLRFSGRNAVLALAVLYYATVLIAIRSASIAPLALITLLLVGLVGKIVAISWNEYACAERMLEVRNYAFVLHLATCSIIAVSSIAAPLL